MDDTVLMIGGIKVTYEMLKGLVVWLLIGSGFIEWFPPIKFKPWSWFLQNFGRVLTEHILIKIDNIETELNTLSKKVDQLEKADEDMREETARLEAMKARRRILTSADKIRRNSKEERGYFSEEYYNDILKDITDYHEYCSLHPNFENEKAGVAIKVIRETYQRCLANNDFL